MFLYLTEKYIIKDKIYYTDIELNREYRFNKEDYVKNAKEYENKIRLKIKNDKFIIEEL